MLRKKQKQILNYIKKIIKEKDYAPSFEEIRRHFKLASRSTVHYHIESLREKGFLNKIENQPRSIELNNERKNLGLVEIPILGTIAAGRPIEAIENPGTITLPKSELPKTGKHYALRVEGDSMIDEGIFDGDTVIIKEQKTAENGETVVAIIGENEATLKKLYREKDRFRLEPANPTLFSFYRKEVEVRGVVIKIIRNIASDIKNNNQTKKLVELNKRIFIKDNLFVNNIYNVDCLNLIKNIKNNSLDLIFADPPYNLSKSNFNMKFVKSGGSNLNTNKGEWDNFSTKDFENFTKLWLSECFRILKKGGAIWVSGTYHNIYMTGYLMQKIGFEILNEILWHKTDATPNLSCTRFVADHENFIWARKEKNNIFNYKKMKAINNDKQMRSIWPKGKTAGGKKIHPTQKPEWLLDRIILATSRPKDVVFDPFSGSGTTAVSAKKFNRYYIGSESDRNYYKQSLKRLKRTTLCNNII